MVVQVLVLVSSRCARSYLVVVVVVVVVFVFTGVVSRYYYYYCYFCRFSFQLFMFYVCLRAYLSCLVNVPSLLLCALSTFGCDIIFGLPVSFIVVL